MPQAHSARDLLALTVLALLAEQPRHPYELQRVIRDRHKDFADGKPRALYHAVDQLAHSGAIEPQETSRDGKRPERTVYRITDKGRDELEDQLINLLSSPQPEYPVFSVAVGFLAYLTVESAILALQHRVVSLESQIAGLDAALRTLQGPMRLPRLFVIEHELTRALRQAERAWVQTVLADLQSGRLHWDHQAWHRVWETGTADGSPAVVAPSPDERRDGTYPERSEKS